MPCKGSNTDNKKFWKIIKPLFSKKAKFTVSITLKENRKFVDNQNEVADIFNNYFSKVVSSLQTPQSNNIDLQSERMSCPKFKSMAKYRRHPTFTLSTVEKIDVIMEINNLN